MQRYLPLLGLSLLLACAAPPTSNVSSFQSRDEQGYVYMLSHTAALHMQQSEEKSDAPIARADFDRYGSCFYRVTSPTKLRLHRQDDLQLAFSQAEVVSSNYIPLTTLWQQFRKDRALQELYTSSRHWLYTLGGGFVAASIIGTIDSFLHRGNGVIVANAHQHVIKHLKEGDKSLRKQTLETLYLVAEAEHNSDELVRKGLTIGKHNPLRHLNSLLMDNKISQGIAALFTKNCRSKTRATACLISYLVAFNSMFLLGLPLGSEYVAAKAARWRNRSTEDTVLGDLLGDRHSLTNTHISSEKTMAALTKIAKLAPHDTPACPLKPE